MSNIEENAFQLARYLLEKSSQIVDHKQIMKDLDFSIKDIRIALSFFENKVDFIQAGQPGTGTILQPNFKKLQALVNQVEKNRIPLSVEAERLLKLLFNRDLPTYDYEKGLADLAFDENTYLQTIQTLKDHEFIDVFYADNKPYIVNINKLGRNVVRRNFRKAHQENIPSVVITAGDNSIINYQSTLSSVTQSINISPVLNSEDKQQLEVFLTQLFTSLDELPIGNEDEAEAVATMAKNLIENATGEKRNKTMMEISAEGLIKAAKNISLITPSVLVTAQAIIDFIQTNFPA